jgi:hypothetical protein
VIGAVAAGKDAAAMIDRYVKGRLLKVLPRAVLPSVYVPPVELPEEGEDAARRAHAPLRPVEERRCSFAEVELPLAEPAALGEARRCLRCDLDFTQPD